MRHALLLALASAACTPPPATTPAAPPSPQGSLVVLLIIDQLPEWGFETERAALTGGFARLVAEGDWHVGRHPSVATLAAVGHALIGSGEPPARSGILADSWWHRELERELPATRDADGIATTQWLRVPGLGDAVATRPGAKAIAVSLEERAALLVLGHHGEAIWYDGARGAWTSLAPISWLDAWNRGQPSGSANVLTTATRAIELEHPDLLVVNLAMSPQSPDELRELDARLATFLADLDRLEPGRWSMIATSDHGASPLPERGTGGRLTYQELQLAANNAAVAVLGPGEWIVNAHYPNVFFSKAMLAQPRGELASAEKRVMFALRSFPGIAQVGRVADFAGHCDTRTGDARALCLAFDPERSGDLFYLPASG